jgi:hypothetical protein
MSKIGEDVKAKQEEKVPYHTLGVVKLDDGTFAVSILKISGFEVLARRLIRAESFVEAQQQYLIESGQYISKYTDKEINK